MFNYVVLSPLTLFCDGSERLDQFTSRCLSYIAVLWSVLMIILPINYTITLNKRLHRILSIFFSFVFSFVIFLCFLYSQLFMLVYVVYHQYIQNIKVIIKLHSITKWVVRSIHIHILRRKL